MKEDLYLLLGGYESDGSLATFKVFVNPLVNWLWLAASYTFWERLWQPGQMLPRNVGR